MPIATDVIPKLTRSPLVFVLAQVRFSPIPKIEDYLADVQEVVRQKGFPELNKRRIQFAQFTNPGKVENRELVQWEYINPDRTASLLIDEASIVLQTTSYDTFGPFSRSFEQGLIALKDAARPTHVQRIGFRCVNVISPPSDPTQSFVHPNLIGMFLNEIGERHQLVSESLFNTSPNSRLVVRYQEAKQGFAFPFDLLGSFSLQFARDLKLSKQFSILDLDHFQECLTEFSVADILSALHTLHRGLDDAFIKLTTKEAITSWL